MGISPDLVSKALRHIASGMERTRNSSMARRDLRRLASNVRRAANGPVSLTTDGEISIYDINVTYQFFAMEKKQDDDFAKFGMNFILGSDLEERTVAGKMYTSLTKLELTEYVYRNSDLSRTGPPGSIQGDPELNRFGLLPNILVKCFRDAMSKMGMSSLKGIPISDDSFHP